MKYPSIHRCLIALLGLFTTGIAVLGAAVPKAYAGEWRIASIVPSGA